MKHTFTLETAHVQRVIVALRNEDSELASAFASALTADLEHDNRPHDIVAWVRRLKDEEDLDDFNYVGSRHHY